MSTPVLNTDSPAKNDKKGAGFFQVSSVTLQAIARAHLGPDALCAYIILAGGVNSSEKRAHRASTHSANSIHCRTMMSRTTSATAAINDLVQANVIQRAPAGLMSTDKSRFGVGSPRWIVDSETPCDLAIAQSFLQPRDLKKLSVDEQTTPGSLAHLCHVVCNHADGIPRTNALVDALLMYFALHGRQGFDKFAGVDPRAVGAPFKPIQDEEDGDETTHIVPISDLSDWVLVTEKSPTQLSISDEFAVATLGCVQPWDGAPPLIERAQHAIAQLQIAKLVYSAAVLWDVDPVSWPSGRFPTPLHTLYVQESWANKIEHQLQGHVHKVMLKTRTRTGQQVFGDSRGLEPNWVGRRIHRFIVPQKQFGKAVLMSQLRVRWWPQNADTISALLVDQKRVKQWCGQLDQAAALSARL